MKSEKFPWLMKSLNVNYERMEKRGEPIKEILDNGSEVNMITRKGTDVTFDIKGMKSIINSGIYKQPGSGGNLPAGEVYLPPTSKGTNGTIIIDGSIKTKDTCILLEKPVTLTIKEGDVVNIKGNDAGLMLEQSLQWAARTAKFPWGVRRIGELGIGINPSARIIGPTIINEKALGTAHVAIGSNAWFGGTIFAKIHLDQVLHDPIIKVDGKLLRVDKELNTTKANNKQWHSNKSSW